MLHSPVTKSTKWKGRSNAAEQGCLSKLRQWSSCYVDIRTWIQIPSNHLRRKKTKQTNTPGKGQACLWAQHWEEQRWHNYCITDIENPQILLASQSTCQPSCKRFQFNRKGIRQTVTEENNCLLALALTYNHTDIHISILNMHALHTHTAYTYHTL